MQQLIGSASPGKADEAAPSFEDFFRAAYPRTVTLVTVITGERASAEDACQEAFAMAFTRWSGPGRPRRPEAWVRQVAARKAVDAWRRNRREQSSRDGHETGVEVASVQRLWVEWGLTKLTPMQRRTFLLRYRDGLTDSEVSNLLQRSPATVRSHLQLARNRLRALLAGERRR